MSDLTVTKTITIPARPDQVWRSLTDIALMPKWMSETEMTVTTDWIVGTNIVIQGRWHKMKYKNVGTVLTFDPNHVLSYSHLSSLSQLDDIPENHSHLTFKLDTSGGETVLHLTISNCPTYEIFKHLDFYWNVTLQELSSFARNL